VRLDHDQHGEAAQPVEITAAKSSLSHAAGIRRPG
jgi:hypothetical protein